MGGDSAQELLDLATHFAARGWDYTRVHDVAAIRLTGDRAGYHAWRRRVARAARCLLGPGTGARAFAGSDARGWVRLLRGATYRVACARVALRRPTHLPDGVLDQGRIVTFWEEDGEYLQLVQPSVGELVARFLLEDPDHPHAVRIRAELDRIRARYADRVRAGQVTGAPAPDDGVAGPVAARTVAPDTATEEKEETVAEKTWTFFGHWEDDRIVVDYAREGEHRDDRVDDGRWEQGLWSDAGTGPTLEAAMAAAIEEYVPATCAVCGAHVARSDPADPASYVHAEDGDRGDHTAEYTPPVQ
jgi:hypothetical protein